MLLSEFQYHLPENRIARYPLPDRDRSKLLVYQNGAITHSRFDTLAGHIPAGSLLVFNDTRVIPARAILSKSTGARIELLLLHPESPTRIISEAMAATAPVVWECLVGNKKRWKEEDELHIELSVSDHPLRLTAKWKDRTKNLVTLSWTGNHTFLSIVTAMGQVPLPPYLGREAESTDRKDYQTVYAREDGAVAAPTAGLHFTKKVLEELSEKEIDTSFVTLHVGAGTFQPIKTENIREHDMHSEQIVFTKTLIDQLLDHQGKLIGVGTTSLRSLESLYWFGVKCLSGNPVFLIEKNYPQQIASPPSKEQALEAVRDFMGASNLDQLVGETAIFITPGYEFRMIDALITNFHQPGSTLILLIAAFTGGNWRTIYEEALDEDYRFLSYGDSSLLWRSPSSVAERKPGH